MTTVETRTHENKTLYLEMANRGRYVIHPNGNVERTDMYLPPSGQWQVTGLVYLGRGGGMIPLEQVTPEWVKSVDLSRYGVMDLDHGTMRQWGNDTIRSIHFYDRPEDTNYYQYSRDNLKRKVYTPY